MPSDSLPTTSEYPSLILAGRECGRSGNGPYAAAASANEYTSCPFALSVRDAYVQSGAHGASVSIDVFSSITQTWYTMRCSGDQPVTCVGGNQAVVYVYGGTAIFTR